LTLASEAHLWDQIKLINSKWTLNLTLVHPTAPNNTWTQSELKYGGKGLTKGN